MKTKKKTTKKSSPVVTWKLYKSDVVFLTMLLDMIAEDCNYQGVGQKARSLWVSLSGITKK